MSRMRGETSLLTLVLVASLAGCQRSPAPDLDWLYSGGREQDQRPPVVLIHGLLGARLVDRVSEREIWPGGLGRMLFSRYTDLALPIDDDTLMPKTDDLYASTLFDASARGDYYGRIQQILEGPGGYRRGEPGTRPDDRAPGYYVLHYDWRQGNLQTAARLNELIKQLKQDHDDPDLQVDIIAHSMGGLAARYYARYGTVDLLDGNDFPVTMAGADNIRRMILLGTPNLGSVTAITAFIDGETAALRKVPPEVLLTMPSMYQLFPHALHNWLVTLDGRPLERDQFEARIWRRFQIGPWDPDVRRRIAQGFDTESSAENYLRILESYFEHQIERARRFTWSLTVEKPSHPIEIILFGGDCAPTPARLLVEDVDGESRLRLWPREITRPDPETDYQRLMLEPGDGTVTKASLLARNVLNPSLPRHRYIHFPNRSVFFLCENHKHLTSNITFQDNLLHALMRVD